MVEWGRLLPIMFGIVLSSTAINYARSFMGQMKVGVPAGVAGVDLPTLAVAFGGGYFMEKQTGTFRDILLGVAVGAGAKALEPMVSPMLGGLVPGATGTTPEGSSGETDLAAMAKQLAR